jgi:hypothetical protein
MCQWTKIPEMTNLWYNEFYITQLKVVISFEPAMPKVLNKNNKNPNIIYNHLKNIMKD